MSVGLEFLREAKAEAADAARYYERRVPGLGARFQAEIERACTLIRRDPQLCRVRSGGHRRVNLPGFPYCGERVLIAAVGHASRSPGYWKQRDLRSEPEV